MRVLLWHLDGKRKDEYVPWEQWWGRARGNPRKLGERRVSLPLFGGEP